MESNLKITIITVSYNCVNVIAQAIESVLMQSYSNIEYIIIDGNSADGTKDVIAQYSHKITHSVSEEDHGIYDAMNKGIKYATGDYIYFLGADDSLIDSYIVERIVRYLREDNTIELLSGYVWCVDEVLNLQMRRGKNFPIQEVLFGKMIPHQGLFVKTDLMKEYLFNGRYQIAADFEFILKCVLFKKKFKFINEEIAFYSIAGESSRKTKQCAQEYLEILKINHMSVQNINKFLHRNKRQLSGIKRRRKFIEWFYDKINCLEQLYIYRGWQVHQCNNSKCRWCTKC